MTDYHVRHSRLSSSGSGSEDFEDESLDPRIQVELEKLNKASEEINRLELELDDARACFRQTLSDSTHKLDMLAKKLGSCVEKARPYYDARVKAKDAHLESQRAALRFERACSMHEAAKEMVQLAEQGYMRREQASDPAWQEMLNHATMKVNEAEKERNESELEHQRTMIKFKVAEDTVQGLQKDLKRAITKSKPYFEMKAKFNQIMEEHKHKVSVLEEDVSSTKGLYSAALRSLEAISDDIHRQRHHRRQQQQLGVRGAGVGAECPLPPPSWEKGIEGRAAGPVSMDPLGVVKMEPSLASSSSSSSKGRSRNLSGESYHGKDLEEENLKASSSSSSSPPPQSHVSACPGGDGQKLAAEAELGGDRKEEDNPGERIGEQDPEECKAASPPVASPVKPVLIPGDPLGVVPPVYSVTPRPSPISSSSSISHPAFSGGSPVRSALTRPLLSSPARTPVGAGSKFASSSEGALPSSANHVRATPGVSRTQSASPEAFTPQSLVPAHSEGVSQGVPRRQSYRQAVDSSQRDPDEDSHQQPQPSHEDVHASLPQEAGSKTRRRLCDIEPESRQRSYSNPVHPSQLQKTPRSPPHAIPGRMPSPALQEALADGRRHGSAPEKSESAVAAYCQRSGTSPPGEGAQRSHKLQGLILRIDPTMDPLRNFEPGVKGQGESSCATPQPPPPSRSQTSPPPPSCERDEETPTPTPGSGGFFKPKSQPLEAREESSPPTEGVEICERRHHHAQETVPQEASEDGRARLVDENENASYAAAAVDHHHPPSHRENNKPIIRSASSVSAAGSERSETEFSELESVSATQSPTKPRWRLLHVPSTAAESVEDSSDTESLASTGPMLDDEQVEFLTMDFSDVHFGKDADDYPATLPYKLQRNSWSRMSLPPRLSHLEGFLSRSAKRLSGEFESQGGDDADCEDGSPNSPREESVPSLSSAEESPERVEGLDGEIAEESKNGLVDGSQEDLGVESGDRVDRDCSQDSGKASVGHTDNRGRVEDGGRKWDNSAARDTTERAGKDSQGTQQDKEVGNETQIERKSIDVHL